MLSMFLPERRSNVFRKVSKTNPYLASGRTGIIETPYTPKLIWRFWVHSIRIPYLSIPPSNLSGFWADMHRRVLYGVQKLRCIMVGHFKLRLAHHRKQIGGPVDMIAPRWRRCRAGAVVQQLRTTPFRAAAAPGDR